MSRRQQIERVHWFHGRVKAGKFPNSVHLSREFEISGRTALRDIEFMREYLRAPLTFDRRQNGYCYSDTAFEIPNHWINETNVLALSLAVRLASTIPDITLKNDLCRMISRITSISGKDEQNCLQHIDRKISVKNIEYALVNSSTFRQTVESLFSEQALQITYHSPHDSRISSRTVQPLHLMHYMGSWHLIAWCTTRNALRNFALARIRTVAQTDRHIAIPADLPDIKEYTRRHFGIMQSGMTSRAVLRFSPQISPWISEQSWHPEQKVRTDQDGSLHLEFPVADFRELVRTILSHGAQVQVIDPPELKSLLKQEIDKMAQIYRAPDMP